MSQNSLTLPTTGVVSGLQMTQNINNAIDTLNTLSSGASAPASPQAGQFWHDTASGSLKLRDQANSSWISIGMIDETAKLFTPSVLNQAGFVNRFRNGSFDVAQRGTSGTVSAGSSSMTLDGWSIVATGATLAWGQGYSGSVGSNILNLPCASGITGAAIRQRMESIVALPLAGKMVTVQFVLYNNSGVTITPTLTVKHANSADNWGASTTYVNSVSLQSCVTGAVTTVAYSFAASANSNNGLEVTLDLGGALNQTAGTGIQVQVGKADIRLTPAVASGLNPNPPLPELRPIHAELAFCQRYYNTGNFFYSGYGQGGSTGNAMSGQIQYPITMRSSPTVTLSSLSYFNASSASVYASYANFASVTNTSTTAGVNQVNGIYFATSEL